ncbi:MAG: DUF1573 domain-containing protein [Ignavibacteriaceae bacterium]|nr:DUF1573 domain-containing protein [Ignavibacteriaceae bacterium]
MRSKLFYLLFIGASLVFAQLQGPKIAVSSDTHDFGDIKPGEIVKHNFTIANNGGDVLKIENVITSCGCTATELSKRELKPGESVPLGVEFNSTGRSGPQVKYISVMTNDKTSPQVRLTIKGNILSGASQGGPAGPKITFNSLQYDFGIVAEGKKVPYTFTYKNTGDEDLVISDVRTSCGCTAAVVEGKNLKPGESGRLQIELDTSNRSGRMSRNITVTTNEKSSPMKVLTIYADVTKNEKK